MLFKKTILLMLNFLIEIKTERIISPHLRPYTRWCSIFWDIHEFSFITITLFNLMTKIIIA